MKKIFIITIFTLFIIWFTSANDCKSFVVDDKWKIIVEDWMFWNILPKPAFEKAVENLQKFCCSEKTLSGSVDYCKDINIEWSFPASAYLFDHILDISIRRLDAKWENQNGKNLIYDLAPDPKWKIWRDFITKHWNNYQGSVPLEIVNEFKNNWEIKNHILSRRDANYDIPWSAKTFEDYDNRTLWEKYNGICEISTYIYWNKVGNANKTKLHNSYLNCKSLINKRIKNEYEYTNAVLMQKWNTLLRTNINTYLDKYFSQNKMIELQQMVFDIKTTFSEINRTIRELVPNCSK